MKKLELKRICILQYNSFKCGNFEIKIDPFELLSNMKYTSSNYQLFTEIGDKNFFYLIMQLCSKSAKYFIIDFYYDFH